ncbi:MAG: ATP-binding protein [Firmicutes bacterium]|nr:ATP-binding protein [Candidatus Fermentithermobacillaceae bacterium]
MDGFNFALQPIVDEANIRALVNLDLLCSAENILFLGPSGIGKPTCPLFYAMRRLKQTTKCFSLLLKN